MKLVGGERTEIWWPNAARHFIVDLADCGPAKAESWIATIEDHTPYRRARECWLEGADEAARQQLAVAMSQHGVTVEQKNPRVNGG